MPKVGIIGAGIAGCTTALEMAKNGHEVTIFEQNADILQGTSSRTPGRMGLGYHYFDFDTAKLYMEQTINFIKRYPDCFLGNDSNQSHLQNGHYFIVNDSLIETQELMYTYDQVAAEYEKMVREDPSNNIFNTTHLHRSLNPREYRDEIDSSKVSFAIETKERLLDWKKFDHRLRDEISNYSNIRIITDYKIDDVSMAQDGKFILLSNGDARGVEDHSFDYIVNCSWQNIDLINQEIGLGDANIQKEDHKASTTSRLKLLAEVEIPAELQNSHSMFFCVGPHAMFSNLGNGVGRLTYAPVTNFDTTTDIKMPENFERWLSSGLNEEESAEYGQKIIDGVSQYIPAMKDAKLIKVMAGIVKSKGDVQLSDKDSSFHKRNYSGVVDQQIGWVDNSAMKLFYCLDKAKNVATIINNQEEAKERVTRPAIKIISDNRSRKRSVSKISSQIDRESSSEDDIENEKAKKISNIKRQFLTNYIQRNFEAEWLMENSVVFYEDIRVSVELKKNIVEEIKSLPNPQIILKESAKLSIFKEREI